MDETRSEHALVVRWAHGDREAGATVVTTYLPMVRRFFLTKLPEHLADDLVQRTFRKVQAAVLDRGAQIQNFPAFLMRSSRNVLLTHLRDSAVALRRLDPQVVSMQHADPRTGALSIALREERQRRLQDAMTSLPIDAQITLELYYWEDLSTKQIAEVLGVAPGTVMSRLARARNRLKSALEAADGGEVPVNLVLGRSHPHAGDDD